jgi:hypothetical protein
MHKLAEGFAGSFPKFEPQPDNSRAKTATPLA